MVKEGHISVWDTQNHYLGYMMVGMAYLSDVFSPIQQLLMDAIPQTRAPNFTRRNIVNELVACVSFACH